MAREKQENSDLKNQGSDYLCREESSSGGCWIADHVIFPNYAHDVNNEWSLSMSTP